MNRLIEAFDFPTDTVPKSTVLNKVIFKKLISENVTLDITDKKALRDDIFKIHLLNSLKPDTTLMNPYSDNELDYTEIAVLQIDLSNTARIGRIISFMNKAIPYPLILIFAFNNTFAIATAEKRINQADKSKMVLGNISITDFFDADTPNGVTTEFLQSLAFKKLSFTHLYAFYTDIINRIIAFNSANRTHKFIVLDTKATHIRQEKLTQITILETEIASLRINLKKENQFNRQMELNIAIKQKQEQVKAIEGGL
jgi:hypothetical protein